MDRFFYLITDEQQNIFVLRTHQFPMHNYLQLKDALQQLFISDKFLQLNYKRTKIGLISTTSVLIPADLYDETQHEFYAKHSLSEQDRHTVLCDELVTIGAYQVYTFHQDIVEVLQNYFRKGIFCHATSGLLTAWHQANAGNGKQMFVNVVGQHLQIAVFEYQKLLFSNTFNWRASLDLAYYIILVFNQLEMDPAKISVRLYGEIGKDSEEEKTLTRYIRHLEIAERPSFYRFGKNSEILPPQAFFDLFSLKLSG